MKKRIIIISSIVFALILIATMYMSFGYVPATIVDNDAEKKYTFLNEKISLEYSDGSESILGGKTSFIPGTTISKKFTLKNTGNVDVEFSINLEEVVNTFLRKNDIVYEIMSNNNILSSGEFPSNDALIVASDRLSVGETKEYILNVKYLQALENQIIDSGKIIGAKIIIDEKLTEVSELSIYGNSIEENIINEDGTLSDLKKINSVGDKTINLFNISNAINDSFVYNEDKTYTLTGLVSSNEVPIQIVNNTTFAIEYELLDYNVVSDYKLYANIKFSDGTYEYIGLDEFNTFTFDKDVISITLLHDSVNNNSSYCKFRNFMISIGNTRSNYEPYGYKIPILIDNVTTNIFISEPLRKINDYVDYLDYENKKIYRNVSVVNNSLVGIDTIIEEIEVPIIVTENVDNLLSVGTSINPSNIEVEYKK